MQFTEELYHFLYEQKFALLQEERRNLWGKREEDTLFFIYVIPERLPGQKAMDLREVKREQQSIENAWLIRTGCRVEWLTLMVYKGEPSEKEKMEIKTYDDIWCVSLSLSRIFIYENQRGDFCNLYHSLEDFLYQYHENEKKEQKRELKQIFTPVNTVLVGINILVFVILSLLGDVTDSNFMAEHGGMVRSYVLEQGQWYRLVTAMFIHFGADHLIQNMIILLVTGSRVERIMGRIKYAFLYMSTGVAASLTSLFVTLNREPFVVSGGASGAIFGVLGAILGLILKDLITGKRKRINDIGMTGIIFMIASALSYGFLEAGVDNAAHVGGLIAGIILSIIL